MQSQVSQLTVYPIKSTAGITLSNAWVDQYGLAFDRRFVLTDPQGAFITARTEPSLCLIRTSLTEKGLVVIAPDMPLLTLNYDSLSSDYQSITVWRDTISGQHCDKAANLWFSQYLSKPCQLMYFGEKSSRKVKNSQQETAFSDGYPLLLISQGSLDYLNQALDEPVSMAHFRPNIVVENCEPFAEDSWKHIRIGEVEFMVTKPCSRCIFTTIDPDTAHKNIYQEPLKTLKTFRQVLNGDVMFGQNLVPLNQGQIKVTDTISALSTQMPPRFMNKGGIPKKAGEKICKSSAKEDNTSPPIHKNTFQESDVISSQKNKGKVNINYESWNKSITGNTRNTLLEQGEEAGLLLPYSCRGGMCGRCKMKLISGDVKVLADDGLSDAEKTQGYVLSCSCIPQSDISVSKP